MPVFGSVGGMMNCILRLTALIAVWPLAASAGKFDRQLQMLDPEERAHQVCVIRGIDTIRREGKLPRADRLKTSINGRATFTGKQVTTKFGAVRAKSHWYNIAFTCDVSDDQMKALSFKYEIGKEIPEDRWDDLGLWR